MNDLNQRKNQRVLVVDDNRAIHDDFRKILCPDQTAEQALEAQEADFFGTSAAANQQSQFQVDSAYDGQEGVMLARKAVEEGRPYAMAFMDVRMPPGMDGVEATQRIWEIDGEIQIVICTAYSDASWDEMLEKIGNNDRMVILKKPFDAVEAFQLSHLLTEKWWLSRKSRQKMEELEGMVAERVRELHQTNEMLQMQARVIESMNEAVIVADEQGLVVAANPAAVSMFGYEQKELLGQHVSILNNQEEGGSGQFSAERMASLGRGSNWLGEISRRKKDGTPITVRAQIGSFTMDGKRQFLAVQEDITERKLAEMALRASDSRFREMLENVKMIAMTLDVNGNVTFCNDYLLTLTGRTRDEAMGEDWFSMFIPAADGEGRKLYSDTLATGNFLAHYENSILTKAGEVREVAWNSIVLRGASGTVIGIACLGEDITERQKHQRLALRSQRLESLGTLAGGVAHDLNNALAPIMLGVELIKRQYPAESKIIDVIQTSAKRGADMVQQLLTFARGGQGERASIQPGLVVAEMEKMILGSFPKNIELRVHCEPSLPTVEGDATQVHQVLLNLCVNARDAMPQGGTLILAAGRVTVDAAHASAIPDARPGDYVVLSVRDTGTGIPSEILDRIFDPFFSTRAQDKGTGLGLSTVLGIVKGHGGFLQVHTQPGRGSIFAAYLPAHGEHFEIKASTVPDIAFRGQGEMILLVDDESSVRETARAVLQGLNFNVVTAIDGLDGLAKVEGHRAELSAVITDLHMPNMDGLTFVRTLRETSPNLPVMVTSGRMEEAVNNQFKALGVTCRLDKPFVEAQLAKALRTLLTPK